VLPPAHRKPSNDASARPAVARFRPLAVSLNDQPYHCWPSSSSRSGVAPYAFIRSLRFPTTSKRQGRFQSGSRIYRGRGMDLDIVDVANHDSWKPIEDKTLAVY